MELGSLLRTNNIQEVQMASVNPNTKILFVSDPEGYQDMIRQLRMVVASAWVPDYNVMEADLNGDVNEFTLKYLDYLNRPESQVMFATILLALYQKKDLVMYFPPEALDFKYPDTLMQYIYDNYGICVGNSVCGAEFNQLYSDRIYSILYSYSFIPPQDYILGTSTMDINDLIKVIHELQIPIDPAKVNIYSNPKPVLDFIESYKQSMLQAKKILFKPMIVGDMIC